MATSRPNAAMSSSDMSLLHSLVWKYFFTWLSSIGYGPRPWSLWLSERNQIITSWIHPFYLTVYSSNHLPSTYKTWRWIFKARCSRKQLGCLTEFQLSSTRIASCGPSMREVTFTVSNQLSPGRPKFRVGPRFGGGTCGPVLVRQGTKSENRCWTYSSSNRFKPFLWT